MAQPPQKRPQFRPSGQNQWGQNPAEARLVRYVYNERQLRNAVREVSKLGTETGLLAYSDAYRFVHGHVILIASDIYLTETVTLPRSASGLVLTAVGGALVRTTPGLDVAFAVRGIQVKISNIIADQSSDNYPSIFFRTYFTDDPNVGVVLENCTLKAVDHCIYFPSADKAKIVASTLYGNLYGGGVILVGVDVYTGYTFNVGGCQMASCAGELVLTSANTVASHFWSGSYPATQGLVVTGDSNAVSGSYFGDISVSGDDNTFSAVKAKDIAVTGTNNAFSAIRATSLVETGAAGNNAVAGSVIPTLTLIGAGSVQAAIT